MFYNFEENSAFIACDTNLKFLMERLEHDAKLAKNWLKISK